MGERNIPNPLKIDYSPNRNIGLDLLRVIAIFMVMLLHSNAILPSSVQKIVNYFYMDGVTIFFVLSGFLIGGIFIRDFEKRNNEMSYYKFLKNFITRRWFRTLPNYYFVLTLIILYFIVMGYDLSSTSLIEYYLFFQNFAWDHPPFFPEAWSLAVEEWFYLLIPFSTLLIFRIGREKSFKITIISVAIFIIAFVIAFRYNRYLQITDITDFDLAFRKQVILRFDSLMFGILSAVGFHYNRNLWKKYSKPLSLLGILLLAVHYYTSHFHSLGLFYDANISFLVEGLSIFCLLPFFYYLEINKPIFRNIIVHNSIISYSVYLLNYSIVLNAMIYEIDWRLLYRFILKITPHAHTIIWMIKYISFWGITILLSTINYNYFELYFIKLRNKITKE